MPHVLAILLAAALSSRIDAIAREALAKHEAPGIAVGVMQHGEVVIARGYGLADVENNVAVTADSAFPIASVTKNMTAVAILRLAEQGKLSLDDDICKTVPSFAHCGEGVTIRRLLDNTAGVHSFTAVPAYWSQIGNPIAPAKLLEFFRDAPLDFPPGSSYSYSNSGYVLLGLAIEKTAGIPYGDYLRSVWPKSMNHTTYCGGNAIVPSRVRGYSREGDHFVNARFVDMSQGYAAGGVCSSVHDLLEWQNALHHGKLLSDKSYRDMTTAREHASYALGIGAGLNDRHRVLYHAGGINGFDAMVTHYPDDDVSIVVLANSGGELAGETEWRIATAILGIAPPKEQALSDPERAAIAGKYGEVEVVNRDGALFTDGKRMRFIGGGTFVFDDSPQRITIEGGRLRITQYGALRYEAKRKTE
jgi:D-alanyl-D-alanine carboxypeptidase